MESVWPQRTVMLGVQVHGSAPAVRQTCRDSSGRAETTKIAGLPERLPEDAIEDSAWLKVGPILTNWPETKEYAS